MRLGKSPQAIIASEVVAAYETVVVAPANAVENWKREYTKFGSTKNLNLRKYFYSYDYVTDNLDLLKTVHPNIDLLILDEYHYLKEPQSARTKAIFGESGLARNSHRVWALSGTPMPNHAGELWVILSAFGATTLKYDSFVNRYCIVFDHEIRGRYVTDRRIGGIKKEMVPELRELLSGVMLRRLKSEVWGDAPSIDFQDYPMRPGKVELDPETRKKLDDELEVAKQELNSGQYGDGSAQWGVPINLTDAQILGRLELLAKATPTLRRINGLKKVVPVANIVAEELEVGAYEKIVIFGVHTEVIEGLARRLAKYGVVTITGKTPQSERMNIADQFQDDDNIRVFAGNIKAAGVSIPLWKADQEFFIEQDWVPGNNAQAAMRCDYYDRKKVLSIRNACIANTLDERISAVLTRKSKDILSVVG